MSECTGGSLFAGRPGSERSSHLYKTPRPADADLSAPRQTIHRSPWNVAPWAPLCSRLSGMQSLRMTDAMTAPQGKQDKAVETGPIRRFISVLGPGLITGASDDDPSGIG